MTDNSNSNITNLTDENIVSSNPFHLFLKKEHVTLPEIIPFRTSRGYEVIEPNMLDMYTTYHKFLQRSSDTNIQINTTTFTTNTCKEKQEYSKSY